MSTQAIRTACWVTSGVLLVGAGGYLMRGQDKALGVGLCLLAVLIVRVLIINVIDHLDAKDAEDES